MVWTTEGISGSADLHNEKILITVLTIWKPVIASYFMPHANTDTHST